MTESRADQPTSTPAITAAGLTALVSSAPQPAGDLIGRAALLDQLDHALTAGDRRPTVILVQLPGVGKTAVASALAARPAITHHYPDGVLWASLGLRPDLSAILTSWLRTLGLPVDEITRLPDRTALRQAVSERLVQRRALLLLDDAWRTSDLQSLLLGGPSCAHLVTTRHRGIGSELGSAAVTQIVVPELDDEVGLALLRRLAPEAVRAGPAKAQQLVSAVGGLPLALVIMGRYLAREARSGQRHRAQAALERLGQAVERLTLEMNRATSPQPPLAAVPISLLASIRVSDDVLSEAAQQSLRRLSVLPPKCSTFTIEQAAWLTEVEPPALTAQLAELVEAGLLELVEDIGPTFADPRLPEGRQTTSDGPRYMLPRTIADYARFHLDDATIGSLHRRAKDYARQQLVQIESDSPDRTSYVRMTRYVDPDWQKLNTDFFYHLDELESSDGLLYFAQVYFDAFWWWGCYTPFPFCQRLLDERRANATTPAVDRLVDRLTRFNDAYPTGYEGREAGDWATVERLLIEIRSFLGLDEDLANLAGDQLHVRALTDVFLAEASRYQSLTDPRADAHYAEALALVQESEDDLWNVPWILWHLADLALARGQLDQADELARQSRDGAWQDEFQNRDYEVIANALRVEADVAWQRGDWSTALDRYRQAGYFAYVYLHYSCTTGPNFYTLGFYGEMTTRLLRRLAERWAAGATADVARWIAELAQFWQPYRALATTTPTPTGQLLGQLLTTGDWPGISAAVFPAPPDAETPAALAQLEHTRREQAAALAAMTSPIEQHQLPS